MNTNTLHVVHHLGIAPMVLIFAAGFALGAYCEKGKYEVIDEESDPIKAKKKKKTFTISF